MAVKRWRPQDARDRFAELGLTYADVGLAEIGVLRNLLEAYIAAAAAGGELSVSTMRLSPRMDISMSTGCGIEFCHLYVDGHCFEERQCISFERDGFIDFCGWADSKNEAPIVGAFAAWLEYMRLAKGLAIAEGELE